MINRSSLKAYNPRMASHRRLLRRAIKAVRQQMRSGVGQPKSAFIAGETQVVVMFKIADQLVEFEVEDGKVIRQTAMEAP